MAVRMFRAPACALSLLLAACAGEQWSRPNTTDRERMDDAYRCEMRARQQLPYFGNDPDSAGMIAVVQAECMREKGYRVERK